VLEPNQLLRQCQMFGNTQVGNKTPYAFVVSNIKNYISIIVYDNFIVPLYHTGPRFVLQAAAKVCLLQGNFLQAFDLSLQVGLALSSVAWTN
jgi:hypothetical protein